ncbi:MAG: heme-binding protein [Phycisphaerales bacterium]
MPRPRRVSVRLALAIVLLAVPASIAGCVRSSGGTWYVASADRPEGWPELTPVGEVRVQTYPAYRAAVVGGEATDGASRAAGRMFQPLFRHIKAEGIPMTAPVEMGYVGGDPAADAAPRMKSMAFLYPAADVGAATDAGLDSGLATGVATGVATGMAAGVTTGPADDAGAVRVVDVLPRPHASVGVRGGYTQRNFERGLAILESWLARNSAWQADGPPRYLGYNGPFTLPFLRYGEVQLPVVQRD